MPDAVGTATARWRRALQAALTLLAFLLVWAVLVLPERLFRLTPAGFLRIPLEGVVLVGLAVLLPRRWMRVVATTAGVVLGLVTVVRILDLGFHEALHRPFNPVTTGDSSRRPSTCSRSRSARAGRTPPWPAPFSSSSWSRWR